MEFIGHLRSSQRYSSLRQDWFLPTRVYLQKRKSKKKSPKRPANKPVLNYQYSHSVVSAPSAESLHKSVTDKKTWPKHKERWTVNSSICLNQLLDADSFTFSVEYGW